MEESKLTERQKQFCREYIIDFNGSRAARAAGYSEDSAGTIAWENLKKPDIQEYISSLRKNNLEKLEIDSQWVLISAKNLHDKCIEDDKWNPSAAAKAIQLVGQHIDVCAFEKETKVINNNNIMPVPTCDSVDDWEQIAQENQKGLLGES